MDTFRANHSMTFPPTAGGKRQNFPPTFEEAGGEVFENFPPASRRPGGEIIGNLVFIPPEWGGRANKTPPQWGGKTDFRSSPPGFCSSPPEFRAFFPPASQRSGGEISSLGGTTIFPGGKTKNFVPPRLWGGMSYYAQLEKG